MAVTRLPGMTAAHALARGSTLSEAIQAEVTSVREHTRKRQAPRQQKEATKLTTASTFALKGAHEQQHYAEALRGVLLRYAGDGALAVARELVHLLETK